MQQLPQWGWCHSDLPTPKGGEIQFSKTKLFGAEQVVQVCHNTIESMNLQRGLRYFFYVQTFA